jgi:hypothetical protein
MQQLNAVCSRYGCRVLLGSSAGWQLALSCVDFGGVCCDGEASRCCFIHIVRSTACPPALLGPNIKPQFGLFNVKMEIPVH